MAVLNLQTAQFTTNTNPYTLSSYTPASGSNRVLVVRVHGLKGDDTSDFPVSSVTFGGVNLTEAVTLRQTSTSRGYRTAIWYLVNPSSSAGNIVVTFGSGGIGCIISAVTLTDIDQTTPLGVTKTDTSVPNAYGYGSTTTAPTAGSTIIGAVTSNCSGNQTWTWFDSGGTAAEEYDIRAGSNTNSEVAGSGGYVIDLQPASPSFTTYWFGSSQTGSNPQSSCGAEFLPATSTLSITPDGIGTAESIGAAVVTRGAVVILPSAIATLEAIGAAVVTRGAVSIGPSSIVSAEMFGSGTVAPGAATIAPNGMATGESVPSPVVTRGAVSIAPNGIGSAESLGGPTVTAAGASIAPAGIASAEALGAAAVSVGAVAIAPSSVGSAESVGELVVSAGGGIVAGDIGTGESFGEPVLVPGAVTVLPSGITSDENVNGVTVSSGVLQVLPDSIASAESLGTPLLSDNRWIGTIESGNQDATEDTGGFIYLSTTSGNVHAAGPYAAFLFPDIPVPAGATIIHAYLRLYTQIYDDPALTIRAALTTSPAALAATLNNISARTLTGTGVSWVASNLGANKYNDSADFGTVVQEVVNLPGWTEDASDLLVVLIDNGTGGHIRFNMADSLNDRPQLVLDFVVGDTAQTITATGIPSGEAIGDSTVTPGMTTVAIGEGIASVESVAAPASIIGQQFVVEAGEIPTGFRLVDVTVGQGGPVVTVADGIPTAEALGEASLVSDREIAVSDGIGTAESLGAAAVSRGGITIAPVSIASLEAAGSPALSSLATILADGIGTAEAFGAVELTPGVVVILAGAAGSAEAFGAALVSAGLRDIAPDGMATAEAFGVAALSPGAVVVLPDGIASGEAVGAAVVTTRFTVTVGDGIASLESVGEAVVTPGAAYVLPDGIGTAESVGAAELSSVAYVLPDGISTAASLGAPAVIPGGVVIVPVGIGTAESLGAAEVGRGPVVILPDGMASAAAFGAAALEVGPTVIAPPSILSAGAFGILVLMSRFLPTVNIRRMPGTERVYHVEVKGRVYAAPFKKRVYHVEE